jgi:RNA polymerase-interacting CarD/CdnL/TRCF family regulator
MEKEPLLDYSEFIGKQVLSSSFGVGKVVSIDDLGMGERLFLVIETQGQSVRNYVAVDDDQSYRLISEKSAFEKIFTELTSVCALESFKSKKDRIDYFKSQSKIQDIELIGNLLRQLRDLDDRSSAEQQLFAKLKETMSLEYSIVMEAELDEAKEIVENALS